MTFFSEVPLQYTYLDPIPAEMKGGGIKISDLCLVPIDWKMLTTMRPKNKIDEDFFSKLVEVRINNLTKVCLSDPPLLFFS